jgi:hypothetical protein
VAGIAAGQFIDFERRHEATRWDAGITEAML